MKREVEEGSWIHYDSNWMDVLYHKGHPSDRVPTAQGKQGKHREFGSLPKHRKNTGNLVAQVVNSLILKSKDISKLYRENLQICLKLDKSAKSVLCML